MERTAGGQLSGAGAEFTQYFRGLVRALGDTSGWYGVYARSAPDAVRAYTDGTDLPPWDVVQALLHDLAALYGTEVDPGTAERAQWLLRTATTEADTAPGSVEALRNRLDTTLRERQWTVMRERDAAHAAQQGPPAGPEAERLANDLAWARDDRERATVRCAELGGRLDALDPRSEVLRIPEQRTASVRPAAATAPPGTERGAISPYPEAARQAPPADRTPDAGGGPEARTGRRHPAEPGGAQGFNVWAARPARPPRAAEGFRSRGARPAADTDDARQHGFRVAHDDPPPATAAPAREHGWPDGWEARETQAPAAARAPARPDWPDGFTTPPRAQNQPRPQNQARSRAERPEPWPSPRAEPREAPQPRAAQPEPRDTAWADEPDAPPAKPADGPAPAKRKRLRPQGARFAGAWDEAEAPEALPGPEPARAAPRGARYGGVPPEAKLRGARFAGAPADTRPAEDQRRQRDQLDRRGEQWQDEVRREADRLGLLRGAGDTGEAYLLMCEAAASQAGRLPFLAAELERRGLAADVATLLWEVASQPPERVVAAAVAFTASGRGGDCRTLLNQAAARPSADVADIASALVGAAHGTQAEELLGALTRARMPDDAVQVVRERPELAGSLLAAAGRISDARRRDVAAVLRREGLPDTS